MNIDGVKQDIKVAEALAEIQSRVGPHGGRVELLAINEQGVALVRLSGACAGCASAGNTLRNVVEQIFKDRLPQVNQVEAIL
ncbi:MAG: NifU family protein [Desulfarculales bacterium]|jgi:Fe-S cluster biogenesis protein NfuA|nr:NifU family protein [Desulfarculales bacterium]